MCFLTGFYSLLRKMFIGRQRGHAQRGVSALQHAPQPWGPPRSLPLVKVTGGPRAGSVCAKPTWQPAPASLALCPLPSEPDSPRDSSATLARGGGRRAQAPCHRAPLLPAARRARSPGGPSGQETRSASVSGLPAGRGLARLPLQPPNEHAVRAFRAGIGDTRGCRQNALGREGGGQKWGRVGESAA